MILVLFSFQSRQIERGLQRWFSGDSAETRQFLHQNGWSNLVVSSIKSIEQSASCSLVNSNILQELATFGFVLVSHSDILSCLNFHAKQ